MGPIWVKKSLEEGPFHKNCKKKIVKSAVFDVGKPLEWVSICENFEKNV